jgi:putative tryptophan/tyrosine transport system substrate-binding protein
MDRRRFLVTSLAGALAAPLAAEAQQAGRVWRIGVLQGGPNTPAVNYTEAVRQGLRDHGYVEGQNIVIEHRISNAPKENPALVADLLGRKIDILVTWTTPALVAAKKATSTIPIVGISGDPVQTGLVESLARPGGNLTGLAILTDELELKNLQLLKEMVPRVTRVAVLWNPDNPVWTHALKRLQEAAPALGVKLQPLAVTDSRDLEAAFAAAIREKAGALVVFREGLFNPLRHDIVNFAAAHRLPAVYGGPTFIEVGGLLVYAANFLDMIRRAGGYVDKILNGAKPADLPIQQATKFELVINLKTAKALGLTIPPSLLAQADRVVE